MSDAPPELVALWRKSLAVDASSARHRVLHALVTVPRMSRAWKEIDRKAKAQATADGLNPSRAVEVAAQDVFKQAAKLLRISEPPGASLRQCAALTWINLSCDGFPTKQPKI